MNNNKSALYVVVLSALLLVTTASFAGNAAYIEHKLVSDLYGSWNYGDDLYSTSAIDNNRAVIAVNSDSELGARIEMFELIGSAWQHTNSINFTDPNEYRRISGQLLLQGDRLFVVAEKFINNSGSSEIIMFEPVGSLWQQTAVITVPDGIEDQFFGTFGYAYAENQMFVTVGSAFGGLEGVVLGYQWLNGAWEYNITLQSNNDQPDGLYGASIDYDGTHLVVGAIHMNNNDGAVFVYTEQAGVMTEFQVIEAPVKDAAAYFGRSVSIDGDLLAISAPNDDINGTDSGSIYTYEIQQGNWQTTATILASSENPSSTMGRRIWLEDNRIYSTGAIDHLLYVFTADFSAWNEQVIERPAGEFQNPNQALTFSVDGQQLMVIKYQDVVTTYNDFVEVATSWSLDNDQWSIEGDMSLLSGAAFEQMGFNTAIYQNTALVSSEPVKGNQQVFVYQQQNSTWVETQRLRPVGAELENTLVIGNLAINDQFVIYTAYDTSVLQDASQVLVHQKVNGLWIPTSLNVPEHIDVLVEYFGTHISLNGNRMAISGRYYDEKIGSVGQVLMYEYIENQWQFISAINQTFTENNQLFGFQVELSGDLMVISSYDDYADISGRVDVFQYDNKQWNWLTEITPPTFIVAESFAKNIAVHDDWVAVSAPRNEDMGYRTGAVYLYHIAKGAVDRFLTVYAENPLNSAEFGGSLSMDNSRLLVGAPYEDNTQIPFEYAQGAAYLYEIKDQQVNFINHYQANDLNELSQMGHSVDLSGGYSIIGAIGDDQNGKESGSAYVIVEDLIFYSGIE